MLPLILDLAEIHAVVVLDELEALAEEELLHLDAQSVEELVAHEEVLERFVGEVPELLGFLLFLLRAHSDYLQQQVLIRLLVGSGIRVGGVWVGGSGGGVGFLLW